ncbi:MAG: hypothetical protein MJ209_00275 [archaeon]|nr:hypothetical protein [archaeon]
MRLYKRNNQGNPIFWEGKINNNNKIVLKYGTVGCGEGHCEILDAKDPAKELKSRVNAKRKEGYKEVSELHDNAPATIDGYHLKKYLDTYLPKYNVSDNGNILPMLAKVLEDNTPFTKGEFQAQYKINGLRCLIGAKKCTNNLFKEYDFTYQSREGTTWNLEWMDELLNKVLPTEIVNLLVNEGAKLDGELYLPGYSVNEINSFVKNKDMPQHYQLQYWCYDIAVEGMSSRLRHDYLECKLYTTIQEFNTIEEHLNNKNHFVLLPSFYIKDIKDALVGRDKFISLGFEGLIARNMDSEYQFGKRNGAMFKYKKILDGKFEIIDVIPEGKRTELPKFVCKNDINDEYFECTINASHEYQKYLFSKKDQLIGEYMLVEYRERSGVNQVPFHAKGINIYRADDKDLLHVLI